MALTLGKKKCREGLNVCMKYEFNLLHHVGVVAKRVCAVAEAAHEGDDNTPSGPKNGTFFSAIIEIVRELLSSNMHNKFEEDK